MLLAILMFEPAFGFVENLHRAAIPSPCHFLSMIMTETFDFSAPSEWESYYRAAPAEDVLEWHASISFETIAQFLPPPTKRRPHPKILLVGCGNSKLPQYLLEHCSHIQMTLLDTSATCLDQLRQIYGNQVKYVCGDATKLEDLFADNDSKFDMILDKGLADAIFCGEGWDGQIAKLFHGVSRVLGTREDLDDDDDETNLVSRLATRSSYLLISYTLPISTKNFLCELGDDVGLTWDFDVPPYSTSSVGISVGTKQT